MHEPYEDFDLDAVEELRRGHYDRRISLLSPMAREAVTEYFRGNVDAAAIAAERAFQNQRRPAGWVLELRALSRRG